MSAAPVKTGTKIDALPHPLCLYFNLGIVRYHEAWDLQRSLAQQRASDLIPDTLLLLEHPHTYTLGRTGKREHLLIGPKDLQALGALVVDSDRGGDITYHGPGQLVGYPIMLVTDRRDLLRYIRNLEETVIRALADLGVSGGRIVGLSGVWVGNRKICAIGVKMGRVTTHGFALNVTTDLSYFGHIVPCGIRDKGVTSIEEQRPELAARSPEDLITITTTLIAKHFGEVFERCMVESRQVQLPAAP